MYLSSLPNVARPYTEAALATGQFPYLRNLPDPTANFVVTNIEVLVTNDPSQGNLGVLRDAYVHVCDGRITEVGTMGNMPDELRSATVQLEARQVTGKNRIVTPGLMHGHTHLCQTLWRGQGEGKQLLQWLRDHTWPGEAAMDPVDIAMAAHLGAAEALCHGATTCLDMGTVHHTSAYVKHGILPTGLRVWTGNVVMDHMDPDVPFPKRLHESPEIALRKTLETMQHLAELAKKTNQRVNPAVTMRFLLTSEPRTAQALARMAQDNHWVIQTHASESPGEIAAIQKRFNRANILMLRELGFLGPKTFLHHCVHATPEEIALMAGVGATAVHCPGSNGMLGSGIAPIPDFLRAGVHVAIGADGAPCNDMLDLRAEMWAAKVLAGGRYQNSAALSPLDILTMATTGGMHGLGMEKELGKIAVGQRADLVFWNQLDWSAMIDLESNRDIIGRIVRTRQTATDVYVDGQQVVANGEPLFITSRDLFRRYLNERVSELNRRSKELRVDIPWLET